MPFLSAYQQIGSKFHNIQNRKPVVPHSERDISFRFITSSKICDYKIFHSINGKKESPLNEQLVKCLT